MKVYVQWATATASDWIEIEHPGWGQLPRKNKPNPNSVINDQPGWINAVNIEGVIIDGMDCYSAEAVTDGFAVISWMEGPVGARYAMRWTFRGLKPDPTVGGQLNTDQFVTIYAEPNAATPPVGHALERGEVRPWSEFTIPPANKTYYGKQLSDDLFAQHVAVQTLHGWREWAP